MYVKLWSPLENVSMSIALQNAAVALAIAAAGRCMLQLELDLPMGANVVVAHHMPGHFPNAPGWGIAAGWVTDEVPSATMYRKVFRSPLPRQSGLVYSS